MPEPYAEDTTRPENEALCRRRTTDADDTHPETVAGGDAGDVLLHFDGEAVGDAGGEDAEEEAPWSGRPP